MNEVAGTRERQPAAEIQSLAIAASERGDFAASVSAWRSLCELQPDNPRAYSGCLAALIALAQYEESEVFAKKAMERFPGNVALLNARARLATMSGDWSVAERRWSEIVVLTRGQPGATIEHARAVAAQSRAGEAMQLLTQACAAHPDNFDLRASLADAAHRNKDWLHAESLWRELVNRFPDRPRAVIGLSETLQKQKRLDDAEVLLQDAVPRFVEDCQVAEAFARVSVARSDWAQAEARWAEVAKRFPSSISAWHGQALARLKRGDLVGAETLSARAVVLFPLQPAILAVHASIAAAALNWSEAERRWERLRQQRPSHPDDWCETAAAIQAQGRHDDALVLLERAAQQFPDNKRVAQLRVESLIVLGRWAQACAELDRLWSDNPNSRRLQDCAFAAMWGAAGSPDAEAVIGNHAGAPLGSLSERQRLLLQFESLGSDSEFGLVQRYFGIEPLGLFRWAEIGADQLAPMLDSKFEGLGEPQNTRVVIGGDYRVRDKRFGFTTHTWVKEDQSNREKFFVDQCRRLQFLSRNLIDDIDEAEKIFVYKTSGSDSPADIRRLHQALRLNGPATLLYVRLVDESHPSASVEVAEEGLFVAYLDRFVDGQDTPIVDNAGWIEICRKALVLAGRFDNEKARNLPLRDLMLNFESMGSNCEFGYVQRYAGAEPLALLRWSATKLESLSAALEAGLSGVGDPDNTELMVGEDYRAVDGRSGFSLRSFSRDERINRDELFMEMCRRIRFLRKRLLDDLKTGTKIFVHKTAYAPTMEELLRLHGSIRRHGEAVLLNVRLAEPGNPAGTVRKIRKGLLIGYLDRLVTVGAGWSIAYESWLSMCRAAHRLALSGEVDSDPAISSPTVRYGDHLFIGGDTNFVNEQHMGVVNIPAADKAEWLKILEARQVRLAKQGSSFLFLLAPDKQTVYRHLLPNTYQCRQARFLADLPYVLDVAPSLETMVKYLNLYPQTDSHWDQLGAYTVSEVILARFGINMPPLQMTWVEQSYDGDLGSKLTPPVTSVRRVAKLKSRSSLICDNLIPNNGRVRVWAKPSSVIGNRQTRLLLFGDSFSYDLVHFLKEVFDIVVHVHSFAVDYRVAEAFAPGWVICEITERFVARLPKPGDGEPLTALWQEKAKRATRLEPKHHVVAADPAVFPPEAIAIAEFAEGLFSPFRPLLTNHS